MGTGHNRSCHTLSMRRNFYEGLTTLATPAALLLFAAITLTLQTHMSADRRHFALLPILPEIATAGACEHARLPLSTRFPVLPLAASRFGPPGGPTERPHHPKRHNLHAAPADSAQSPPHNKPLPGPKSEQVTRVAISIQEVRPLAAASFHSKKRVSKTLE